MSKGVKKVIGVVAAIAIPFAAPAIASSMALSGVVSSIGMTATSALVGAGLGAVNAGIQGGDVGRGALMGGITGGIGGYGYKPTAAGTTAAPAVTPYDGGASLGLTDSLYNPLATPGIGDAFVATSPTLATTSATQFGGAALNPAFDFAGDPTSFMATTPAYTSPTFNPYVSTAETAAAATAPWATTTTAGLTPTPTFNPYVSTAETAASGIAPWSPQAGLAPSPAMDMTPGTVSVTGAPTAASTPSGGFLSNTWEAVKGKFTPENLADLTLKAGGVLAGSYLAGDGMSDEERALLDQQVEELRTLQQTNASLFAQRLEQAQNLIGESKYFDPEYFGLQRARRAQLAGAKAKRAGLRGLEGEYRGAEARRYDLATARDTGTAYDVGYGTGVQGRLSTMQAGINAMPTAYPSSSSDYANLANQYGKADERRRKQAGDIGDLFGSITGASKSKSVG